MILKPTSLKVNLRKGDIQGLNFETQSCIYRVDKGSKQVI